MNDSRPRSATRMAIDAPPVLAMDALLARLLLGTLCVAAVAVLSLPQARAVSAVFGWTPLWLLAAPSSAWLALQLRRRAQLAAADSAPLRHRRRSVAMPLRRRTTAGSRALRRIRSARAV